MSRFVDPRAGQVFDRSAIVEFRPADSDEASQLFTADVFRALGGVVEQSGWRLELLTEPVEGEIGLREARVRIWGRGPRAYDPPGTTG